MNKGDKKLDNNQEVEENTEEVLEENAEAVVAEDSQTSGVQQELQVMTDLAKQFESQAKRLAADYQNLQRRVQEEKGNWIRSANKDLILKFLPVLDTLLLANKHLQDKGLELAIDQFIKLLEQEGVKRIETIGKDFDPTIMEAVSTMEGEKGKVLEEARAGYMLYDMVIRSAQVIVGA